MPTKSSQEAIFSMPKYDVVLIHPPAIYDFRTKTLFQGPLGASIEQLQFTKVPIGMLSLADYLDRHGYKVKIDNLGDRMVNDVSFDVEKHIRNLSAGIFAIGMHFQQHAPGALAIARLCKQFHPHSPVVLGGLTATCFHEEILHKYEFVDAVVRGEAEKAFLDLMKAYEKNGRLTATPNLTYRTETGETAVIPLMKPVENLDEFEYTRFDLLEPKTSIFPSDSFPRWSLEVCRGCIHNCAICGGSAYSYKTYLGRTKPAFRSPARIVEDIRKLNSQGIRFVGLYQDPRMGGEQYWRKLVAALSKEKLDIERLSIDLLGPADEEFIKEIASTGIQTMVHICPDTGCDSVRQKLGRNYSNDDLFNTVNLCHKYLLPVTPFFSVGLAGESRENVEETWAVWDKLSSLENIALSRNRFLGLEGSAAQGGPIMGPILLDPGSLAFDFPEKYGYKVLYKNLEEYIEGMSRPSWHQWLNYETELLDKRALTEVILQSIAFSIEQRAEYGFNNKYQAEAERRKLKADVIAVQEVERIMKIDDTEAREKALKDLRIKIDEFLKER
jgi:B12-binding domain/radical SAM domain protein